MMSKMDLEKDSKTFWTSVNKMLASDTEAIPYIYDQNGNKLYSDEEKQAAFRRQWRKVIIISEEENEEFDEENEIRVLNDLK